MVQQVYKYVCGHWPVLEVGSAVITSEYSNTKSLGVVVPAHNCEATIEETIASITASMAPGDKIYIIENGSTDNTWDKMLRCFTANPFVSMEQLDEANAASARNRGCELAFTEHEYIAFCDADDIWLPKKIPVIKFLIEWEEFDIAFHPMISIAKSRLALEGEGFVNKGFPKTDRLDWDLASALNFIPTSALVVRKGVMRDPAFIPELRHTQDFESWCAMAKRNPHMKVCFIDQYLGVHRWMGGLSRSVKNRMSNVYAIVKYYTDDAPFLLRCRIRMRTLLHAVFWLIRSRSIGTLFHTFYASEIVLKKITSGRREQNLYERK